MENQNMLNEVRQKAEEWLNSPIDEASKMAIQEMLLHNEAELIESFYRDLEFGTGGLRGLWVWGLTG